MTVSRRALFGKLDAIQFRAPESVTAFARLHCNPHVESTHCLNQPWQSDDSDPHRLRRRHRIDPQALAEDFATARDFSHHVTTAVERARLLTSIEPGSRHIRGGRLLLALTRTPELHGVLLDSLEHLPGEANRSSRPVILIEDEVHTHA